MTYLVYLDAYHLDDLVFLPGLAQKLGRLRDKRPRCLFVHGSGAQAERLLEAEGLFPARRDGLIAVESMQEAVLVAQALRQVNRRVVGLLNEEGVHTIGLQGADRGLLRRADEAGAVTAGRANWLRDLVDKRVVPVVAASVAASGQAGAREVSLVAATRAMAEALGGSTVVFFTRTGRAGIFEGEERLDACLPEAVPEAVLPDPAAFRAVVEAGLSAFLTSAIGLFGADEPLGTTILS